MNWRSPPRMKSASLFSAEHQNWTRTEIWEWESEIPSERMQLDTNFGLENEKPFEVDFTFWYQRDRLLDHAEEPALVFGEAKSFAVGSFEAKDITRMRRLAEKFPDAFLVFAMLKDTLAEHEKA